ncbi:MAG: hypothetical protein J6S08_01000 [Duodenibacillus sp.]|jgi:Tfp pilus assembly protein PilO|nr:hypothetical protein [Duodenibacillus sp.]
MKEQLDQLELSVLRLTEAYAQLKQENAALKAELAQKNEQAVAMQAQTDEVRSRIDQLIAALEADLPAA